MSALGDSGDNGGGRANASDGGDDGNGERDSGDAVLSTPDDDNDIDPREQEAIEEARATGVPPFAREAIERCEEAHDRSVARSLLEQLIESDEKYVAEHGPRPDPPEPLGPAGTDMPTPTLYDVGLSFADYADLRACLTPDGSAWSVYRTDTDRWVRQRDVGVSGNPWCPATGCPESRCKNCRLILAAIAVDEPTHPARAIPHRWPIGARWTWTHAQMQDHMVARLRHEPDFMVETSRTRTVEADGRGGVSVTYPGGDTWDGGEGDAWYMHVAERVTDGWADGGGPQLRAHDCVVGLAQARHALARLNFAVRHWRLNVEVHRLQGPCYSDAYVKGGARLRRCRDRLAGWIAAVESLLRNRAFYLGQVAPYEARLIEAASQGVVSV
nr:hypothetical protein [Pandoravirus aubagnensis]